MVYHRCTAAVVPGIAVAAEVVVVVVAVVVAVVAAGMLPLVSALVNVVAYVSDLATPAALVFVFPTAAFVFRVLFVVASVAAVVVLASVAAVFALE